MYLTVDLSMSYFYPDLLLHCSGDYVGRQREHQLGRYQCRQRTVAHRAPGDHHKGRT